MFRVFRKVLACLFLIIGMALPAANYGVSAQSEQTDFWEVRTIYTIDYGVPHPLGLAYSLAANEFLVWGSDRNIAGISMYEDPAGTLTIAAAVDSPLNVAFDNRTNSLFVLNRTNSELVKVTAGQNGLPLASAEAITRFDVQAIGLKDAQGITFDPKSGRLFILDSKAGQIISISPSLRFGFDGAAAIRESKIKRINIKLRDYNQLRGIAFNPSNGHLYVLDPLQHKLLALTDEGQVTSTYDLGIVQVQDTRSMLFVPSVDRTDDPASMNLILLDSGLSTNPGTTLPSGQIIEFSFRWRFRPEQFCCRGR